MKNFARGLFFNERKENAPAFVLGSLSISKDSFTDWLKTIPADEKGYIKIDILRSKDGAKIYTALNDYKPSQYSTAKKVFSDDPNAPY